MCSLSAVVRGALDGAAGLRAAGARDPRAYEQVAPATRDRLSEEEGWRSRAPTSRVARESERERERHRHWHRHLLDRLERVALLAVHPAATGLSRAPLASRQHKSQPAALLTLNLTAAERLLALFLTAPERLSSPPRAASTRPTRQHSIDQLTRHRHCHRLQMFAFCALLPVRPPLAAATLPPVARISPREGTSLCLYCTGYHRTYTSCCLLPMACLFFRPDTCAVFLAATAGCYELRVDICAASCNDRSVRAAATRLTGGSGSANRGAATAELRAGAARHC